MKNLNYLMDLSRRTAAGKVLCDEVFNIAKVQNTMDINVDLLQWFINFFDKKKLLVVILKIKKFLIKD